MTTPVFPFEPLQWSRFFSKRKIASTLPWRCPTARRFNGAAFFQSGKCVTGTGGRPNATQGFNGAAFFQSGK